LGIVYPPVDRVMDCVTAEATDASPNVRMWVSKLPPMANLLTDGLVSRFINQTCRPFVYNIDGLITNNRSLRH